MYCIVKITIIKQPQTTADKIHLLLILTSTIKEKNKRFSNKLNFNQFGQLFLE